VNGAGDTPATARLCKADANDVSERFALSSRQIWVGSPNALPSTEFKAPV
jgi:hypothetical protein